MFCYQTAKHSVRTITSLEILFQIETNNFSIRLAAVNFFLGCVGVTQVTRILMYQRSQENVSTGQITERNVTDIANTAKGIATNPEGAAQKAVK